MDLVNWNKLDLQEGIKPGQMLKLSQDQRIKEEINTAKTVRDLIHEVKSSDTLYGIARQYGVTIKELMDWNEKKDFSLAVGEKLKIHQSQ
jgi:membrane-bound lytic murein transglycosylase D